MSDKISGSELQEKYDTEASFSPLEDAKKIDVADEAAWNQLIEKTEKSVHDLQELRDKVRHQNVNDKSFSMVSAVQILSLYADRNKDLQKIHTLRLDALYECIEECNYNVIEDIGESSLKIDTASLTEKVNESQVLVAEYKRILDSYCSKFNKSKHEVSYVYRIIRQTERQLLSNLGLLKIILDLQNTTTEFDSKLEKKSDQILDRFNDSYKEELENFKNKELKYQFREEMEPLEQRTLTNVLTIFGVFASFITIVMVLVGTSSSWLNASDFNNAVAAFFVPSGIGVLVVCALTALLRVISNARSDDTPEIAEDSSWQKRLFSWFRRWMPWIIIPVICIGVVGIPVKMGFSNNMSEHTKYVYRLEDVQESVNKEQPAIEFTFFDKRAGEYLTKEVAYKDYENYIHDGEIVYCVTHDCFEK